MSCKISLRVFYKVFSISSKVYSLGSIYFYTIMLIISSGTFIVFYSYKSVVIPVGSISKNLHK
jgi:hypothetical protein